VTPAGTSTATDEIRRIFDGFTAERSADVERVRGWVRAVVFGGNWRFADPDAVEQDALIKILELVRSGKVRDGGGFQKLAHTVARYTCLDRYQSDRRTRERHVSEPAEDASIEGDERADTGVATRERVGTLVYVFQRLPASCRELWKRIYRDRAPSDTIAAELGITVNNLRVRAHRCLEKARALREAFESDAPGARG
jgi:RNA polymerase sigma factor (sigma-70 family)